MACIMHHLILTLVVFHKPRDREATMTNHSLTPIREPDATGMSQQHQDAPKVAPDGPGPPVCLAPWVCP